MVSKKVFIFSERLSEGNTEKKWVKFLFIIIKTLPLDTILSRFGAMITAFNFLTFKCFKTSRKPSTYLRFCLN